VEEQLSKDLFLRFLRQAPERCDLSDSSHRSPARLLEILDHGQRYPIMKPDLAHVRTSRGFNRPAVDLLPLRAGCSNPFLRLEHRICHGIRLTISP